MSITNLIWAEYPFLMGYAKRYVKDEGNRHDIVMTVIEKAIEKKDCFTSGTRLRCWLVVICYRHFISETRKLKNRRTHFPDKLPDKAFCFNSAESILEVEEIEKAILDVKEELQSEVLMRYIEGQKKKDIAADLLPDIDSSKAESKIRHIIREGRKQVRKYLDNE